MSLTPAGETISDWFPCSLGPVGREPIAGTARGADRQRASTTTRATAAHAFIILFSAAITGGF
jgi:hypothetical protein